MNRWEMLVAGFALFAGLLGQIKRAIDWIGGLLVVTVMTDLDMASAVTSYLNSTSRWRSRSRRRQILGVRFWVKSLNRFAGIAWERFPGSTRTLWIGRRPVWFRQLAPNESNHSLCIYSFSFFRWTVDFDAIASRAAMSVGSPYSPTSRYSVSYHFGTSMDQASGAQKAGEIIGNEVRRGWQFAGWSNDNVPLAMDKEDLGKESPYVAGINGLSLTIELRAVASEIKRWLDSEDWHAKRGIAWRRGYLFEGAAGTGKTAFARAMAEDLDLPISVFDLASMSNKDLRTEWAKALSGAPCMVVLEDIDGVFHGRENVCSAERAGSGGLTFDALLNCVDGVERANGVLLIVTTNHPDLVDPALAHRPGRIDRVVKFEPLDLDGRMKLARRIVVDEGTAVRIAVDSGPMPASRFVEECRRVALDDVYGNDPRRDPYRDHASVVNQDADRDADEEIAKP